MVHDKSPMCHRKQSVQKGSADAGPAGKLARFAEIDEKKACDRPEPPVSGMPAGSDDGMIQPAADKTTIAGLSLYVTPSEISKSMRGERRAGATRGTATRAARGAKDVEDRVAGRRAGAKEVMKAIVGGGGWVGY